MPEVNRPVIAAFDFDGTLTRRDTLLPFLIHSLGWPKFLWAILLSSPWLVAFALRLMRNHRAKARLLKVSLAGLSEAQAQQQAQRFVALYLPTQWHTWGMAQLREHQRLGHPCVIVSASPNVYLRAVASKLGVNALLCTEMTLRDGHYTGEMATPNCHGEQKVIRLQTWLRENFPNEAQPEIHAYGDTPGDYPLLRMADRAWYRAQPWAG
jgi:phosphatidylglycerophosphatase C